ncbi:MAG: ChaN family lipoprotein, partial [Rhizobacter sp.]|nr:ChaN family lipoprotein [Rhizobacter sp.]
AGTLAVRGGNLARDEVRRIAREGTSVAPEDLRTRLMQPLPADPIEVLDRGLSQGHCGHIAAAMVPRMREAQAARDLAMADAMLRASAGGARPAVLIAGNGHVRRDHGVPLWLARAQPSARIVSVGFLEVAPDGQPPSAEELAVYDLVWITPRVERPDPCLAFRAGPATKPLVP